MNHDNPRLPSRTAVLVNVDFESRAAELGTDAPRGFEADAAVLDTALAVQGAIERLGVAVEQIRISSSLDGLVEQLASRGIETVFNLIESIDNDYGREWEVPALLDERGIRYTGNGVEPLKLCRAKDAAREVLERAGVRVARGVVVHTSRELTPERLSALPFPRFVKPARVDGSIGIDRDSVCRDFERLVARVAQLERHLEGPYLVEEYLPGKEINVALFPDPVHGFVVPTEIDFSVLAPELPRFVTYDSKWNPESPEYVTKSVPAELDSELRREVERTARSCFIALGGTSYGRVDMRLDVHGRPCVIDVNPNNDLHPEAGLAVAARSVGLEFDALIESILAHAHGGGRGARAKAGQP